ncbi:MAG: tetratricopeptide repeat protein, partial [Bacteroidota bacterium]|nr:tetratricopeptide repeat protein [Bacteroidota bacterium]
KWKKIIFSVYVTTVFFQSKAQNGNETASATYTKDTAAVSALLLKSKSLFGDAPEEAIRLSMQAKDLANKIGFEKGLATACKSIGIGYYNQSKYLEALDYWTQSLHVFEKIKDDIGIANLLNNIGAVYMNQGDDENALKYYLQSLQVSEKTGDKLRIVTAMNNVGAVYYHKKETHDKALDYYTRALKLSEEIGDDSGIGTTAVNLGEIYFARKKDAEALFYFKKSLKAYEKGSPESVPYSLNAIGKLYASKGDYTLASNYHKKALAISRKLNGKLDMAQSLLGIANIYEKAENIKSALDYYKQAETIAREINALHELQEIYQGLANSYAGTSDFKSAFRYQTLFTDTKGALYNIEADKKLASMQFDFDLQKKQGEINLLTKDKTLNEVELKRQKVARNTLIAGLAFVLLIALLLFRNYRIKAKTNKILDKQKDEIEGLLLNILPSEVAKELQSTGIATPRNYESVSVMFTDFKGFTSLADKLSPRELVEELNACFIEFDNIIVKYNLEKIKTIGDSYMCAGGIPTPDDNHPYNIVQASLEIQEYIIKNNQRRAETGLEPWDARIGIHVGPIVAGVVGKKKYAYDIWGNTVNIASRMESNGAAGQVNISEPLYEIVKDKYACTYRGKIYAKNVGEIDMYFVEGEAKTLINTFEKDKIELLLHKHET